MKKNKKNHQGEGGGRPSKFSSDKDLWAKADEYFKLCDTKLQLPEKAGLCFFLNISRETYSQYRKKFPDTIRAIDMYIESNWVRRLAGQSATGAIFYLKNAFKEEYQDKQELEATVKDLTPDPETKKKADLAISLYLNNTK